MEDDEETNHDHEDEAVGGNSAVISEDEAYEDIALIWKSEDHVTIIDFRKRSQEI